MVQVTKQSVQQWILFDYLSKKHRFQDTLTMYERKYGMPLESFAQRFDNRGDEVYEEWDDYIEWKAAQELLIRIDRKIQDVKNGNIELID